MKCTDDELLQRLFDGECSDEEAIRVKFHMSECQHCRHRHEALQARANSIHQAFGMLCNEPIDIPPMPMPEPVQRRISLRRKYVLPLLAAASILLLFLIMNRKEIYDTPDAPMLQSCFRGELDANKPADQQELSFTVVSPDGVVQEYFIRTQ